MKKPNRGAKEKKMDSGLIFFTCISTSEKMVIPAAVISKMPPASRIILRDRNKMIWTVGVDINKDELSFKEGWPQFYEDNCLKPLDSLFFEHVGGCVFDFRILRQNEAPNFRIKEEYEVEEIEEHEFKEDLNEEEEEEDDDDDDDEEYVKEEEGSGTSRNATTPRLCSSKTKKRASDCYGADIFRRGLATRPENRPFFVSRSRPRSHELLIPKKVIVDYKLELPDVLFLVDEQGNKWKTKVKKWGDGRVWCNGGWKSLCNVNNILKDHACICEFYLERRHPRILVRVIDTRI